MSVWSAASAALTSHNVDAAVISEAEAAAVSEAKALRDALVADLASQGISVDVARVTAQVERGVGISLA